MQTLGFLGPSGTHSEAAAMFLAERMEGGAELRPYSDIFSVMQAAADGEVDVCVVPVENSLEGAVNVTMDTLAQMDDLAIERELIWDIHNQLMAKDAAAKVRTIYSHPQPLAQCRQYLKSHFPQAKLVATESTAKPQSWSQPAKRARRPSVPHGQANCTGSLPLQRKYRTA